MQLQLDPVILSQHIQKYNYSCVPMGVELTLKLMNEVDVNYYELQDEKREVPRWGGDYNGRIIGNLLIKQEFDLNRDDNFPMDDLINRIKEEIDACRFVNCAWRQNETDPYHAYVVYGYEGNELLAITKFYNNPTTIYINDMTTKLKNIKGSDIITFTPKNI